LNGAGSPAIIAAPKAGLLRTEGKASRLDRVHTDVRALAERQYEMPTKVGGGT